VKAFTASADKIDQEFGKMQPTISQAMTDLKTVFGRLVSDSNTAAGGTKSVADEIAKLAETIDTNRSGIIELFTQIISLAARGAKAIGNIGQSLQGWAAVKSGQLGLFEFATMNAEDLNEWLKKNNTEEAKILYLKKRIKEISGEIFDLEQKRDFFLGGKKYDQRQIDKAKAEKKKLEDELVALQAPISVSASSPAGNPSTKTTPTAAGVAKKDPAAEAITSLARERDMIGKITEEEKVRWEITKGSYKNFTSTQKEKIILLAQEIDYLSELSQQQNEGGQAIDSMAKERDLIRATTEEEKVRWEVEKGAYRNFSDVQKEKLIALARELDTTRSLIEQAEEGKTLTESLLTPQEKYNETIEHLNDLLSKGAINQETYNRAVAKAKDELKGLAKDGGKDLSKLQQAIEGWGRESTDALVDFCLTGEESFSDLINSMIKDMLRMITYQNLMGPLFSGISAMAGGGTFMGGWSGFGGGRASGGSVSPGKLYEVNERGLPELLNIGNRQFLMMADQSGSVTPTEGGGNTSSNSLTISIPLTVEGAKDWAVGLRRVIEETTEQYIKEHA
jgi:hypothetical protein